MKRRLLRAFAIAAVASSLAGCSTVNNTLKSVLRVPGSLFGASQRSLSSVGM